LRDGLECALDDEKKNKAEKQQREHLPEQKRVFLRDGRRPALHESAMRLTLLVLIPSARAMAMPFAAMSGLWGTSAP